MGTRRRRIGWVLFATLLFSYGYVHQRSGWNQNVRFDLLHALFKKGTVAIDDYHTNTGDKAKVGDHYYCEKAPGGTIVAIPAFALAAMALRLVNVDIDSPLGWGVTEWVATAGSVGVITAVGGVAFFSLLARRMRERNAALATLGVFLGAMPFPYATTLFAHGTVMAALFIALWGLDRTMEEEKPALDALVGFCCGLAVAGEYPAALAAAAVFVAMLTMGLARALRFAAGALAPLLSIPIYHWIVTGSPFVLPYTRAVVFGEIMKDRFVGFGLPKPSVALELLFGGYRGLFFWSPILIFCLPGFVTLRRQSGRLFWLAVAVPVAMVAVMSGYPNWHGGWALGPRLLSPAIPFLAVAAGVGFAWRPRIAACVGAASVLLVSVATFVDAMPTQAALRPLEEIYLSRIVAGDVTMNLGRLIGLRGWWSAVPFFVVVAAAVATIVVRTRTRSESASGLA